MFRLAKARAHRIDGPSARPAIEAIDRIGDLGLLRPDAAGFDGDDPHYRRWRPAVFDEERSGGVQLFELHGSLNRFGNDPNVREDVRPPYPLRDGTLGGAKPQLLLGPAPKEQTDDPYAWLLHRFHETLQHVGFCVVIGFSWRDPHVEERIRHERNRDST